MKKLKNWSKVEKWIPREIRYPTSLEELQHDIIEAKLKGYKIRAIGSLHSYNDICVTNDMQINTDKLDRVLAIDKKNLKIRVESGIKMRQLITYLSKNELTLPNQGYILNQSIAGVISTATHGSGNTGTMSNFVEEIELVDANGKLHILNEKTNDHLFSAALVSLGCLGVVYAVTLKCVPLYKLELNKFKMKRIQILEELPQLLKTNDNVVLYLNPFNDDVLVVSYQKTDAEIRKRRKYQLSKKLRKTIAVLFYEYLPTPKWFFPIGPKLYFNMSNHFSCIDYSDRLLSPEDEGRYVEEEIAIPLEYFKEAIEESYKVVKEFHQNHSFMVGTIVARFVGADTKGYLSPTLQQPSIYITFVCVIKKGYKDLFQAFEKAMMKYRGRPHWGKIHTLTKQQTKELYPLTYDKFKDAKTQLDPNGVFSNGYIDRLFTLAFFAAFGLISEWKI